MPVPSNMLQLTPGPFTLGPPGPVAPQYPPAPRPPLTVGGFLPQNVGEGVTLGPLTPMPPPTPIPTPAFTDFSKILPMLGGAFDVPEITPFKAPPAHKPLKFADPDMAVKKANEIGAPKDYRKSDQQFQQDRFSGALGDAALAATQGNDLGQVLALAGGAFLKSAKGSDEARRLENMQFDESQRAWQMELANMELESANIKAQIENAQSDLEHAQLMAEYQTLNANIQRGEQRNAEMRANQQAKLGTMLQMEGIKTGERNMAKNVEYQNADNLRTYAIQEAERKAPKWQISEDGTMMTRTWMDANGQMQATTEPLGFVGRMKQVQELASMLPKAQGDKMLKDAVYANMASISPSAARTAAIMDILNAPGGLDVLDPEKTRVVTNMNLGGKGSFPDYFNDMFNQSLYDKVIQNAQFVVQDQIERGLLPPEQSKAALIEMVASGLEPYWENSWLDRAGKLKDPNVQQAIKYLKGSK